MRWVLIGAIVLAGATSTGVALWPREAECAVCGNIRCFDKSVCLSRSGCACLKQPGESYGQCVSVD